MSDSIDRQAAIDLVRDVCDAILSGCGSHYDGEDEVYDDLLEVDAILKCNKEIRIALERLPSAESETNKGKWIDDTYCDQCGWTNEVEPGFIGSVNGFHFCPNCGADMRDQEDEK